MTSKRVKLKNERNKIGLKNWLQVIKGRKLNSSENILLQIKLHEIEL